MSARDHLNEANFHNDEEKAGLRKTIRRRNPTRPNVLDSLIPPPPILDDCGECEPDEPTYVECPACGGDGFLLGKLGHVTHFRCRSCGMDFNDGGREA